MPNDGKRREDEWDRICERDWDTACHVLQRRHLDVVLQFPLCLHIPFSGVKVYRQGTLDRKSAVIVQIGCLAIEDLRGDGCMAVFRDLQTKVI